MATTKRTTTTTVRVEFTDKLTLQDLVDLVRQCDNLPMNSLVNFRSPKTYTGEPGVDPGNIEVVGRTEL